MGRHESAIDRLGRWPSIALSRSRTVVETLAFWGAVITPLAYLPVLSLNGSVELVGTLVTLNVACLLVGHRHSPSLDTGLLAALSSRRVEGGEQ
jgi:hypothetical protein